MTEEERLQLRFCMQNQIEAEALVGVAKECLRKAKKLLVNPASILAAGGHFNGLFLLKQNIRQSINELYDRIAK